MSELAKIKSKVAFMETRVPELIRTGIYIGEATAKASEEWVEANRLNEIGPEDEDLEVCMETSLEFSAEVTEAGFKNLIQDDDLYPEKSFAEVLRLLGCEAGKSYDIEICVEES